MSEESTVLNEAAVSPKMNNTVVVLPSCPVAANITSNWSGLSGREMPSCCESIVSNTPSESNRRFTGTKAMPYVHMSFCASRSVLHVRFFCIMFWFSPVMTTTINAPLTNCFQKFWRLSQSSNTNIRAWALEVTASTVSFMPRPSLSATPIIMQTNAPIMHNVWRKSVHTKVRMPPSFVYSHIRSIIIGTVIQKGMPQASRTKCCMMMQTT